MPLWGDDSGQANEKLSTDSTAKESNQWRLGVASMKLIRGTATSSREVDAQRIAAVRYKEAFPKYPTHDIHEWVIKAIIDGMRYGARQAFFRSKDK